MRGVTSLSICVGCSFTPGSVPRDATVFDAAADAQTDFIIEAENYSSTVAGSAPGMACSWGSETTTTGYSGASYMRVVPASGRSCVLANNECAQLVFDITITVPATYYVHVRLLSTAGDDNSLWYGLDGTPEGTDLTPPATSTWTWLTGTSYLLSAGPHTLHLWQRESGLRADVVGLTTSATPP